MTNNIKKTKFSVFNYDEKLIYQHINGIESTEDKIRYLQFVLNEVLNDKTDFESLLRFDSIETSSLPSLISDITKKIIPASEYVKEHTHQVINSILGEFNPCSGTCVMVPIDPLQVNNNEPNKNDNSLKPGRALSGSFSFENYFIVPEITQNENKIITKALSELLTRYFNPKIEQLNSIIDTIENKLLYYSNNYNFNTNREATFKGNSKSPSSNDLSEFLFDGKSKSVQSNNTGKPNKTSRKEYEKKVKDWDKHESEHEDITLIELVKDLDELAKQLNEQKRPFDYQIKESIKCLGLKIKKTIECHEQLLEEGNLSKASEINEKERPYDARKMFCDFIRQNNLTQDEYFVKFNIQPDQPEPEQTSEMVKNADLETGKGGQDEKSARKNDKPENDAIIDSITNLIGTAQKDKRLPQFKKKPIKDWKYLRLTYYLDKPNELTLRGKKYTAEELGFSPRKKGYESVHFTELTIMIKYIGENNKRKIKPETFAQVKRFLEDSKTRKRMNTINKILKDKIGLNTNPITTKNGFYKTDIQINIFNYKNPIRQPKYSTKKSDRETYNNFTTQKNSITDEPDTPCVEYEKDSIRGCLDHTDEPDIEHDDYSDGNMEY